jgi:ABC-2 type transport system ATP-binding protein
LLDEVEKICDAAAIVDRGKVVAQGPISELAGGHARHEVIIAVNDANLAERLLASSPLVSELHQAEGALRVVLSGDLDTAAELNASLVRAGVGVSRLEPVRHSLEQRFLDVISGLRSPTEDQL